MNTIAIILLILLVISVLINFYLLFIILIKNKILTNNLTTDHDQDKWTTIYNQKITELNLSLDGINHKLGTISDITVDVKDISKLLVQNDKAGKAGEYLLNRILKNIASTKSNDNIVFVEQYNLNKKNKDGNALIVDLMIKGNGQYSNIPIDSKFPFNDYKKYLQSIENNEENNIKQQYKKDFFNSVKIHINKVSEYISLDLDNAPYAIMFIPSEAITSFIFNEHHELIDLAFSKKVIICSPSTLMAIIESIDYYLKIFNDIKNIDQNLKIIREVERSMENYDMAIDNLEKAANVILLKIKEVKIKENTLMGKYKKVNKINDDDL